MALQDALDARGAELVLAVCESAVERLLSDGVIRPGERPQVEVPMTGQTTIQEMLDG